MLEYHTIRMVEVSDWDRLVQDTYGKPYNFQQQDGCKERGTFDLTVPTGYEFNWTDEDNKDYDEGAHNYYSPLKYWLSKDPTLYPEGDEYSEYSWRRDMYWDRDFYPEIHEIADDLHSKGLIEPGEYVINIDW